MFHTFVKLKSSSPARFIVWLSVRTSAIFFMTYFIPHIIFGQEVATNNAVSSEKPTQELSNMTVVGALPPGSQESAVQRRETSPNIVDALSHEEIERFSDNDAASAARRLPGVGIIFDGGVPSQVTIRGLSPALNGLTFGGTRLPSLTGRITPLDVFLENLYSRIEVTKANLPDMDAEALGGTVELVPLSPFDPSQSKVDLQLGGRTTAYAPGRLSFAGKITLSSTFGPHPLGDLDNPLGLLGSYRYDEEYRGDKSVRFTYNDPEPNGLKSLASVNRLLYQIHYKYQGKEVDAEAKVNSSAKVYLRYAEGSLNLRLNRKGLNFLGLGSRAAFTGTHVTDSGVQLEAQTQDYPRDEYVRILQFGGQADAGPIIIDFDASAAQGYYSQQLLNTSFRTKPNYNIEYDASDISSIPPIKIQGKNGSVPDYRDPKYYLFNGSYIAHNWTLDNAYEGKINFSLPHSAFGSTALIKFGLDLRSRNKFQSTDKTSLGYKSPDGMPLTLEDVSNGTIYTGLDNSYLGYMPSNGVRSKLNYNSPNTFRTAIAADKVSRLQSTGNGEENVYAGYGQYNFDWDNFGLLAGVRVEATDATYGSFINQPGSNPNNPASYSFENAKVGYVNWFPTVQLRYAIVPQKLQARFSYSTAISRPDFTEVIAATIVDDSTNTITTGNPQLKPIIGNNFEITFDYTPTPSSVLSFSLFDKELDDYIFAATTPVTINGTVYTQTSYVNSPRSYARGLEAQWRQNLIFLPGFLKGLGVIASATYVDAKGNGRANGSTVNLPGASRNLYNAGLYYEHGGLQLALIYNFIGRNLVSVGDIASQDIYLDDTHNLDFRAAYQFKNGVGIFFNAKNLLSDAFGVMNRYEGDPRFATQRENYSIRYESGITFKF